MPYQIRHRPNHPTQAKVYVHHQALSNKWLTEANAKRQKYAVMISEKQRKAK